MKHLSSVLLVLLVLFAPLPASAAEPAHETAFDRVMRTKVLRCGYVIYEPFVTKDINSGRISGLTVDYVNTVAQRLGLTVEWNTEVSIDQIIPALDSGRIDAFCAPCTPNADFEKVLNFSGHLGALPYYTYVPAGSTLTREQLEKARFALQDGFALTDITRFAYPHGSFYSLPQTTSTGELYGQLRFGKADALVNDEVSALNYMRENAGIIRRFSDTPVVAMRMFLLTPKSDEAMARYFDEHFSVSQPDNLELMKSLRAHHNMPDTALLLPDVCTSAVAGKGWKVCDLKTSDR